MHLFNRYVVLYTIHNIGFLSVVKNTMVTDAQYLLTYEKKAHARTSKYIAYYFGTSINGLGSSSAWKYT